MRPLGLVKVDKKKRVIEFVVHLAAIAGWCKNQTAASESYILGRTASEGYVFSALWHSSNTGIMENIYNSFLRLRLRKHIGSGAQLPEV